MSIEAVQAISSQGQLFSNEISSKNVGAQSFSEVLKNELVGTELKIQQADKLTAELALGKTENLHQVMIGIQEAKASFELMVQIRNRLLEGYQEIIKMQV